MLAVGCGTTPGGASSAAPATSAADTGSPTSPDTAVSTTAGASGQVPTGKPEPVKPVGDTINPRKIPFTTAKPVSGGKAVRLVWWSGVAPCSVLDRVTVKETAKRVTITLYEGPARKAKNTSCIMIAVEKTYTVKLKKPLGNRKIVDGAKP
ncbi:hypothetical protein ACIBG7_30720 [Nonomuraea sp. NPDC050328]